MTRVKRGVTVRRRHKKVTDQTKGFYGRSKNCYRLALTRLEKALQYSYRDRRNRKRDFRRLWIQRINAAARGYGSTYSKFMNALKCRDISLNRKSISELAVRDSDGFKVLIEEVLGAGLGCNDQQRGDG